MDIFVVRKSTSANLLNWNFLKIFFSLQTCRLRNAGTPCRSALQECDLPEYCTGKNEFCPADLHKLDGIPCGQDKVCRH